jgi:cytochrome P450
MPPRKPTLFDQVLDSKLSPEEKTPARLAEEVRSAIGAGTETTSNALTVITFHLLENPGKLRRLRDELRRLEPDQNAELKLRDLEQLPYLVSPSLRTRSARANSCSSLLSFRKVSGIITTSVDQDVAKLRNSF